MCVCVGEGEGRAWKGRFGLKTASAEGIGFSEDERAAHLPSHLQHSLIFMLQCRIDPVFTVFSLSLSRPPSGSEDLPPHDR